MDKEEVFQTSLLTRTGEYSCKIITREQDIINIIINQVALGYLHVTKIHLGQF